MDTEGDFDCARGFSGSKEKQDLERLADYVRRGGDLRGVPANMVSKLQDYALDIGDNDLYDTLEIYWG